MNNKIRIPQQNRGIQTRENLIIAAIELFSEKGYHSTNSKEIAAKCGVAVGSFYAYFRDKKELFIEAYKYYTALLENELIVRPEGSGQTLNPVKWESIWNSYPSNIDNREKLKIIFTKLIKIHYRYPGFPREVTIMRLLDPDIKKVVDEHEKEDMRKIIDLVQSLKSGTRIHDIDIAANIIYRSLDIIFHETIAAAQSASVIERTINELTDLFYRYIFND
jgi:AcrR family transcriptional regulator